MHQLHPAKIHSKKCFSTPPASLWETSEEWSTFSNADTAQGPLEICMGPLACREGAFSNQQVQVHWKPWPQG